MTFADDIEEAAEGEEILGVVVSGYRGHDNDFKWDDIRLWQDVRLLLNYDYDTGFGTQDCHSFYAWTASRVLFVYEYDGATRVHYVPRHPIECKPMSNGNSPQKYREIN